MADPARQASAEVAQDSWSCSSLQRTPDPWGSKGPGGQPIPSGTKERATVQGFCFDFSGLGWKGGYKVELGLENSGEKARHERGKQRAGFCVAPNT